MRKITGIRHGMEARIEDIVGGKRLSDRVVAVISGSENKEEGVE